jgi:hypothetical protein
MGPPSTRESVLWRALKRFARIAASRPLPVPIALKTAGVGIDHHIGMIQQLVSLESDAVGDSAFVYRQCTYAPCSPCSSDSVETCVMKQAHAAKLQRLAFRPARRRMVAVQARLAP